MKITNLSLLKAMQYADEKLVEQTAPFDDADTDEMPGTARFAEVTRRTRITRRVMEAAALCAAVVFCVLAVYGISRLNRTENPRTYADSTPEEDAKAAREVVNAYLNAILENTSASRKRAIALSVIEKWIKAEEYDIEPEVYLPDEDDVPQSYSIPDDCDANCLEKLQKRIELTQMKDEYEYLHHLKMLNPGDDTAEIDEYYHPDNDKLLSFYKSIERYYEFPMTYTDKAGVTETDTISAVRIDTVWYAFPFELFKIYEKYDSLTEDEQQELAKWKQEFTAMGKEGFVGSPMLIDCPLPDFSGDSRVLVSDSGVFCGFGTILERDAAAVKKLADILLNVQWEKLECEPCFDESTSPFGDGSYIPSVVFIYNGNKPYKLDFRPDGYVEWYRNDPDAELDEPVWHGAELLHFRVPKEVYPEVCKITEAEDVPGKDLKYISYVPNSYQSIFDYVDQYRNSAKHSVGWFNNESRIRLENPEYAPYLLEYEFHSYTQDLCGLLNCGIWLDYPADRALPEGAHVSAYFWNEGEPCSVTVYPDAKEQVGSGTYSPALVEADGVRNWYLMDESVAYELNLISIGNRYKSEGKLNDHLVSIDADEITYKTAWADIQDKS